MLVGIIEVTLSMPENGSLKGKRKVVKSLIGRLRSRYNVSAAEVADNDIWQQAVIGVSVVGNDGRFLNSVLDKILDYIERETEADVTNADMDIIQFSGGPD